MYGVQFNPSCISIRAVRKAFVLLTITGAPLKAEVVISGGMEEANPWQYNWTLINQGEAPVNSFEVPHFRGMRPTVPQGWTFELTEQAIADVKTGMGIFRASCPPSFAVRDGASATFGLQLHIRGADLRVGTATVGLADGRTITIEKVEYPGKASKLGTFATPIGLGVVFVIILAVKKLRGGKPKTSTPSQGD